MMIITNAPLLRRLLRRLTSCCWSAVQIWHTSLSLSFFLPESLSISSIIVAVRCVWRSEFSCISCEKQTKPSSRCVVKSGRAGSLFLQQPSGTITTISMVVCIHLAVVVTADNTCRTSCDVWYCCCIHII